MEFDYLKVCPNYYSNWEDGCCMENCTFNDLDECPIHYVKGLLEEKDKAIANWETMYKSVVQTCGNDEKEIKRLREQLALTEKAIIVAYKEHKKDSTPSNWIYHISKEEYLDYIKTKAKEMKNG